MTRNTIVAALLGAIVGAGALELARYLAADMPGPKTWYCHSVDAEGAQLPAGDKHDGRASALAD